jgi:hypothetical protein
MRENKFLCVLGRSTVPKYMDSMAKLVIPLSAGEVNT